MHRVYLLFAAFLFSTALQAQGLQVGGIVPDLEISELGEIRLQEEEFSYQTWAFPQDLGRLHVVQYVAATMAASKLNEPFTDSLSEHLAGGNFTVTTVVNMDDAMWGTSGFVVSEVKKNKKRYPDSTMVLDKEGVGRQAWQLERKSSAIVIVDASGRIQYLKEGAMDDDEIESALELMRAQLSAADPS
jgi:YtfJ family uncharacterized protein